MQDVFQHPSIDVGGHYHAIVVCSELDRVLHTKYGSAAKGWDGSKRSCESWSRVNSERKLNGLLLTVR